MTSPTLPVFPIPRPRRHLHRLGTSVAAAIALAAASAVGSSIDLRMQLDFRGDGSRHARFEGSFRNEGTATACEAALRLETPFGETKEVPLSHIDPRTTREWSIAYDHPDDATNGLFAAVVRVGYQDSNGFPLGTAFVLPYRMGVQPEGGAAARLALSAPQRDIEGTALSGVAALQETAPIDGSAPFTLRIAPSPDAAGLPASLRIVLPDSMGLHGPAPTLDRIPDGPVEVSFVVTNLAALAGTGVRVSAVLDATAPDGTHRCATAFLDTRIGTTPPHLRHLVDQPRTYEREARAVALAILAFFLVIEVLARKSGVRSPESEVRSPESQVPSPESEVRSPESEVGWRAMEWIAVLAVWALVAWQVRLPLVFTDTLCLGGDLPAHHYLFSHLRESLAHGRMVSWAPGWWCGFPMYQYYFPLPYLGMVVLDLVLPSNIAFKLALVLGLFLTPLCTLAAARLLRLPRPAPALLVLATVPLLCDTTHTMWGVNIASTLSGMISNSWSFAFFPLAIASAVADMRDNRPRARTALLFVAVLLSHFFTSIVLALLLALVFAGTLLANACLPAAKRALHPLALVPTGLCAALLMAWWVLPLVATRPWSVDYGDPWDIHLFRNLPIAAKLAIAAAAAAVIAAWRHAKFVEAVDAAAARLPISFSPPLSEKGAQITPPVSPPSERGVAQSAGGSTPCSAAASVGNPCSPCHPCETIAPNPGAAASVALAILQGGVSIILFRWGYSISKVFVNCRLWPFLVHALLVLGALGGASLLRRARRPRAGLAVAALLVFAFAWDVPNFNRAYALWDFQGIEALPDAPVFFDVADRLRGTPGRFAYDMHSGNERLGSSRAFEALPAVCGKPIVEGGILNSALGALIAYSVQGEMSDSPAGWPLRVIPKKLDAETGTRHLELLGVRHFLARSGFVQEAIEKTGRWTLLHDYGRWRLYENTAVDGSLVHAYPGGIPEQETDDPQGAIVDWAQDPALADTPVVLCPKSEVPSPKSQVRSSKSQVRSPKSEVLSPKSEVQTPESEVQSPESRVGRVQPPGGPDFG